MLSHVYVGVSDLDRASAFYEPIMALLALPLRFKEKGWCAWHPAGGGRPLFIVGRPFDRKPASPGNGQMIALLAPNRPAVDQCHALALAGGGTDEGAPGLRPHYHPNYYGCYFRDPDGNKLCVVCHDAPAG